MANRTIAMPARPVWHPKPKYDPSSKTSFFGLSIFK
jgi:hypothetical protein